MNEPTTLRDAISSAIEDPEEKAQPAQAELDLPVDDAGAQNNSAESAEQSAEPAGNQPGLTELAEGADNEQVQQQPRDDQGKFAKQEGVQPGPKSGPKAQAERPPASWKPDAREHWSKLPDNVRSEIARRETEVQRTLQDTAEARKTAEAVMRTIAPYEAFIKAENSNPLQAIDNLMATAAKLRTGTAPELATMVAGIVQQFGIGRFGPSFIEALDGALAGNTPRVDPQQAALDQVLNQRLAPVQQLLSRFEQAQQAQQQQVAQQAQSEVEQFLARAEFGNDVREDMADLLEAAQRRGQNMTLADAYKKACMMSDSVRSVLVQRQQAQRGQVQTQAAQRARQAAVSVSGGAPVGALQQPSTDVRSAIEAAIVATSR